MPEFKDRYVLGEGYPWAIGQKPHKTIAIATGPLGVVLRDIAFPVELWSYETPKYRLVLERVKKDD